MSIIIETSMNFCSNCGSAELVKKIPEDMNIEINISCPNMNKDMVEEDIQKFINEKRKWCILKLSPLCTEEKIDNFYQLGFRQFHCCNTLPTINGGLSGESLIPYSTKIIQTIKRKYTDIK